MRSSLRACRSTSVSVAPGLISKMYVTSCPSRRSASTSPASQHSPANSFTSAPHPPERRFHRPCSRPQSGPPQGCLPPSDGNGPSRVGSADCPPPNLRRMCSIGIRVPLMTGFPNITSGSMVMRSCVMILEVVGEKRRPVCFYVPGPILRARTEIDHWAVRRRRSAHRKLFKSL